MKIFHANSFVKNKYTMMKTLLILILTLTFSLSFPNLMKAHSSLLDAIPAPNVVSEESPEKVALQFNEPVELDLANLIIYDWNAETVFLGKPDKSGIRSSLVDFTIPELADGTYTIKWSVVSLDGHTVNGSYPFIVGKATEGGVKSVSSTGNSDGPLIVARTIAQGLIILIAGLYLFSWLAERRGFPNLNDIVTKGKSLVITIIILATLAELITYAISLPSGLIGFIVNGRWDLLKQFPFIIMVVLQFILLLLLLIPGMQRGWYLSVWFILASGPALGGHVWGIENTIMAIIPRVLHLIGIALWLGALFYVILLIFRNKATDQKALPENFRSFFVNRMIIASGLVVLSGVLMVVVQTSLSAIWFNWINWSTLLLIKVILTVAMLSLALYQTLKWNRKKTFTTKKLIRIEWLIGIGIIFVGVWLSQINYPIAVKSYDEILAADNHEIVINIDKLQTGNQEMHLRLLNINEKVLSEIIVNLSMPEHHMRSGPFTTEAIIDNSAIIELPFTMPGSWRFEINAAFEGGENIKWMEDIHVVGE